MRRNNRILTGTGRRVLMLAEHLPPHIGGVERHLARVARELTERGFEVTLFTVSHCEGLPAEEDWGGVRVLRSRKSDTRSGELASVWGSLARNLRTLADADIVHLHSPRILTHWFLPFRLLFLRKPCFITFHGASMRYRPLRKEVLQKQAAQAVSSGSILVGHFLKKWFGLKSNFVTWGGVDLPQEAPLAESNCGALFLGRLSADTVPLAYLDAMSLVDRGLRDKMKLTFVGDGPSHAALEEKARRASFEVRFEGFQENPTRYIAGCGLLFAPGYLSILEGLAWRKPIFCLAANEMRMDYFSEIAECSRSIHLAREPSELARLVGAWLEKSPMEKAEILEAGFELARFHSWQKVTDLYISLWQS